jgi:hypothetical protein
MNIFSGEKIFLKHLKDFLPKMLALKKINIFGRKPFFAFAWRKSRQMHIKWFICLDSYKLCARPHGSLRRGFSPGGCSLC